MNIQFRHSSIEFNDYWDILGIVESNLANVYRTDLIEPGFIVLDLGAGIGDFTIVASQSVGDFGKVLAIEPNPNDFKQLVNNLQRNHCTNVIPVNVGISNTNSIDTIEFKNQSFKVNFLRLQDVIDEHGITRFDFIKMDVEGFERSIVEDSMRLVENSRYISMEIHGGQKELESILERHGYLPERLKSSTIKLNLLRYALKHPLVSLRIYSIVRKIEGYSPVAIVNRFIRDFHITDEERLMVVTFISNDRR